MSVEIEFISAKQKTNAIAVIKVVMKKLYIFFPFIGVLATVRAEIAVIFGLVSGLFFALSGLFEIMSGEIDSPWSLLFGGIGGLILASGGMIPFLNKRLCKIWLRPNAQLSDAAPGLCIICIIGLTIAALCLVGGFSKMSKPPITVEQELYILFYILPGILFVSLVGMLSWCIYSRLHKNNISLKS